jgi:hypothetical protein
MSGARFLRAAPLLLMSVGCYHFSFEQRPVPAVPLVTYKDRVPTYINGFFGTGTVETRRYCEHPVRTELRVTAVDVLVSMATLLIYTPHTLYTTCPVGEH